MDEVERLLQYVQDQLLLNISVNFHIAHASASNFILPLNSDLDYRFQALKSSQPFNPITSIAANQDQVLRKVLNDNLSSRFAEFKVKFVPNSNSLTSSISTIAFMKEALLGRTLLNDKHEVEDDEGDKLIGWAKDEACHNPSLLFDDDDEDSNSFRDEDEQESEGKGFKADDTSKRVIYVD